MQTKRKAKPYHGFGFFIYVLIRKPGIVYINTACKFPSFRVATPLRPMFSLPAVFCPDFLLCSCGLSSTQSKKKAYSQNE